MLQRPGWATLEKGAVVFSSAEPISRSPFMWCKKWLLGWMTEWQSWGWKGHHLSKFSSRISEGCLSPKYLDFASRPSRIRDPSYIRPLLSLRIALHWTPSASETQNSTDENPADTSFGEDSVWAAFGNCQEPPASETTDPGSWWSGFRPLLGRFLMIWSQQVTWFLWVDFMCVCPYRTVVKMRWGDTCNMCDWGPGSYELSGCYCHHRCHHRRRYVQPHPSDGDSSHDTWRQLRAQESTSPASGPLRFFSPPFCFPLFPPSPFSLFFLQSQGTLSLVYLLLSVKLPQP